MADEYEKILGGICKCLKDMGDGTHAEVMYLGGGTVSVQLGDIQLGSIQILGANGGDLAAVDAQGRFSITLPAGAATEASLAQAVSALGNLVASAAAASTAAKQDAGNTSLASIDGKVATASKQDTQSTKLDTIAANVAALTKPADVQPASQSGVWTVGLTAGSHVTIDNVSLAVTGTFWQSVQPVSQSGAWTVAVSNASIAVTGPLTDALLRASAVLVSAANLDVALSTRALESGGNLANIKTNTDKLDVALSTVATAARQDAQTADLDAIKVATQAAATAAKQDTGNASLASLDGKSPVQGQALATASVPVVLASDSDTIKARIERRIMEMRHLDGIDAGMAALVTRKGERFATIDRRGCARGR